MQVKQLAEWANTTVRTVRHYHHLGLLEVPPTMRGRRDYTIAHLARLLRIRWLVDGGVPLSRIKEILAAEENGEARDAIHHDLRVVREAIVVEQQKLTHQLEHLDELIVRVENGEELSPAPTALSEFYDDLARRLADLGRDQRMLQIEHQIMTVMAAHGMVPPSANTFIAAFDEEDRELCVRQIIGFDDLAGCSGEKGRRKARELAQDTWSLALKHKQLCLRVLDDLPGGAVGRTMWALTRTLTLIGYPHPMQLEFTNQLLVLLDQDPDFFATIRRWAGEEPRL